MANWANITATKIEDAAGNLMASGRITFTPTDVNGNPLTFYASMGGLVVAPASTTITNGVIASGFQVASNSSTPSPYYTVTITDNTTGNVTTMNYVVVPDAGLSLDTYVPTVVTPAGGVAASWTGGAGSPNGVVTAPVGSLYTRTDGGAGTTLYVKESGTGNTGWVGK